MTTECREEENRIRVISARKISPFQKVEKNTSKFIPERKTSSAACARGRFGQAALTVSIEGECTWRIRNTSVPYVPRVTTLKLFLQYIYDFTINEHWTSCMFFLILFSFLCPSFVIVDQGNTIHFTPCLFFALIILFFPWNRTLLRETPIWFR